MIIGAVIAARVPPRNLLLEIAAGEFFFFTVLLLSGITDRTGLFILQVEVQECLLNQSRCATYLLWIYNKKHERCSIIILLAVHKCFGCIRD